MPHNYSTSRLDDQDSLLHIYFLGPLFNYSVIMPKTMARRAKLPHKFTAHKLDKHRRLLAEIPRRMEERHQSIQGRNQLLAATRAYNLKIEKRRVKAHLSEMPGTIQRQAALDYMGDLDRRIHTLAATGLP